MKKTKTMTLMAAVLTAVTAFAHNFGDETVAFFPFDDGAVGSSAKDVTLKNAIAGYSSLTGRVVIAGKGTVTFSDETPGAYLYTNYQHTADAPAYSHPKSLYFSRTGGKTGSDRGTVVFDDLIKEAQKLGAYKIEFWYKLDTGTVDDTSGFFDVYGGWSHDSGDGSTIVGTNAVLRFHLRSINAAKSASTNPYHYVSKGWRNVSDGSWSQSKFIDYDYPKGTSLVDGKWHQVSFAIPEGSYTATTPFAFGADMNSAALPKGLRDPNVYYSDNPEDGKRFVQLNASGAFVGWISCVRLSTKAGGYLRPWSVVRPREYLRYRFEDGVAGQAFGSGIVTNTVGYEYLNPGVFVLPESMVTYGPSVGRAQGNGEVIAYQAEEGLTEPTAAADVKRTKVLEAKDDAKGQDNALSAKFVSPTLDDASGFATGYALLTRVGTYCQPLPTDAQTFEFFFKFDYEDWKARTNGKKKEVSLMWMTKDYPLLTADQYYSDFGISMDFANEKAPTIACYGYTGSTKTAVATQLTDGKWHHLAVTFEPYTNQNRAKVNIYLDYKHVKTDQDILYFKEKGAPFWDTSTAYKHAEGRNIWFARATSNAAGNYWNNAFNGKIDEIRVTQNVLAPDEFLRQKNLEGLLWSLR